MSLSLTESNCSINGLDKLQRVDGLAQILVCACCQSSKLIYVLRQSSQQNERCARGLWVAAQGARKLVAGKPRHLNINHYASGVYLVESFQPFNPIGGCDHRKVAQFLQCIVHKFKQQGIIIDDQNSVGGFISGVHRPPLAQKEESAFLFVT